MLLNFKVSNYKSFVDKVDFSMIAAPKQSGLDYSLMKVKHRRSSKIIKGLSSSVIYGPNAAGKTNVIGAMDTLRAIVLRGNIRNAEDTPTPNTAAYKLELIPNNKIKENRPVEFEISFYENENTFNYLLVLDLGYFMQDDYKRKIIKERLKINNKVVFCRNYDSINIENTEALEEFDTIVTNIDLLKEYKKLSENRLADDELFLVNGFKIIFAPNLVKSILSWFTDKFMVIYRADSISYTKRFDDPKKSTIYVEKTLNQAATIFGINSNAIGYVIGEDDSEPKLCSAIKVQSKKKDIAIASEIYESYGTIRFINIFPLVMRAIKTGGVLIVDEFDASIHPMALMNILNIFHNDNININHAQLIFNTHNPIFLNSNILRRDEIKFVERDDITHLSKLYALSSFGTSGEFGVRKHDDYLKCYFINQYGAIKNVDFTPVFEELQNRERKDDNGTYEKE